METSVLEAQTVEEILGDTVLRFLPGTEFDIRQGLLETHTQEILRKALEREANAASLVALAKCIRLLRDSEDTEDGCTDAT
jgi:hypothetical protein